MRLALRELWRRPGRFAIAGGVLTFITLLLLFLGGLLDGLYLGSTGVLRAQEPALVVYADDARLSVIRSQLDAPTREAIEGVDGVEATYGIGVSLLAALPPGADAGSDDVVDVAVIGYEGGVAGVDDPPAAGEAYADSTLEGDVDVGDTLEIGPENVPVEVIGWVDDTSYLNQAGLWVEAATWREILAASIPAAAVGEDTFQVLTVEVAEGADADEVAAAIDDATGTTETVTTEEAILALPGVSQQTSTFNAIIGTTFFIAAVVTALFFALVTIERVALYGVLKAVGASSGQIAAGLAAQAVTVAVGSFLIGGALMLLAAQVLPDSIPLRLEVSRAVQSLGGLVLASVVGAAISFRRVIRIDPASAIS
ncbi:MAG: ABC transporter permease [Actinomycetota bacterium]|nr:ABC transporter permease [Actinomycetota bacterium]